MYRKLSPAFFFLLFILCLFSCKKEKSDLEPSVTFILPNENQSFKVNDNILVQATVRDESKLTSLSISLLDANQSAAHISVAVPVSSASMTISAYYPLNNIHLESGLYYLEISASDGVNVSHTYRIIYINALPRILRNVYVVTKASANQVNLSYIDSTFNNIIPYHNFASDYIGSSISSYYQQAYVCGNYTGSFTGIKLIDKSQKFTISPIVSSEPYFTGLYNDDKNNYVARYDGFMKGYDFNGNTIFSAEADLGFYPQHMFLNNNYFISEQQNKTSGIKKLVTYFYTGTPQQTSPISQDVIAFCEKDNNNVFLFGNSSGQGVIQLFDRVNNNIWNPYPFSLAPGAILSAVKISAETYLIGHSNGTIYKYTYQSPGVFVYLTGYTAIQLKYDAISNKVYVAEANRITSFDYPSASIVSSINSTETVLDIHLLYNR